MAKILFVEDEPAIQKVLGDFLRGQGHEVLAALDGEQGLAMMMRQHPDLVLLDLILPRLHGLMVLEKMKADQSLASIPVIVLTNVESSDAVEKAIELGAKAYLVKANYRLEDVLEKIRGVLGDQT